MEEYKQLQETEIVSDSLSISDQRSLIFHLLYAVDVSDYQLGLEAIVENFFKGFSIVIPRESYVYSQASNIIDTRSNLDEVMLPLLSNWRIERLGVVTKLIIRLGLYELMNNQAESAVIINECIELAKGFAEKDSYKFVNAVLDEFIKRRQAAALNS